MISIHALLAESDLVIMLYDTSSLLFLSTLSLRRATSQLYASNPLARFLSTLSLRRATWKKSPLMCIIRHFYPRSPCGERLAPVLAVGRTGYFYPRSPCGERPLTPARISSRLLISIHALLAESDYGNLGRHRRNDNFYPRSPCGERRLNIFRQARAFYFYPRSPCGERPIGTLRTVSVKNFYPRSPCGERPNVELHDWPPIRISIHALLAESDSAKSTPEEAKRYFYPRSPCGERQTTY